MAQMRLIEKNIKRVSVLCFEGIAYCYHVTMRSGWVSDSREYINRDENGRTTIAEYSEDRLPKEVQKFIKNHTAEDATIAGMGEGFSRFIYM